MRSKVEESFTDFFEKWMAQLEECADLLLIAHEKKDGEKDHDMLVNKLTSHYKNYYTVKWAAAREDVLAFFAPVWLTSLESAYLWVTGWKPSMAFRLAAAAAAGMSEEQAKKVEVLRGKIKAEEEKVEREMERQQVAMADRRMVELARLSGGGGGDAAADVAVKNMLGGLEKVMKMADCVRLKTLKGLLDVMGPTHSVHFLASASMLQIQMRKCGKTQDNLSLITNS